MARILIGNIKGPKGDTGPQGEQGPVGPQGPQGPLPPLVNNALSTEAGVAALDAVMGKTLQDQITQVNSDLSTISDDLEIQTGSFQQPSEYLTDQSTIIYQNVGNLLSILNFRFYLAKDIPANASTMILQLPSAAARNTTYFSLLTPNGLSFPCNLNTSGDMTIFNYMNEAIVTGYQLYGQVVFIKKSTAQ